jgi:hypothetical protein
VGALLLVVGCGDTDPDRQPIEVTRGHLLTIVGPQGEALGLAALVRVTPEWGVALAALRSPPKGGVFVSFGRERVPVEVRDCGPLKSLEFRRGERELRPVALGAQPKLGEGLVVFRPGGPPLSARVTELRAGRVSFQEVNQPGEWQGGVVLSGANLVGFVAPYPGTPPAVGQPRALLVHPLLAGSLPAICQAPGADALTPRDGFEALELSLVRSTGSGDVIGPPSLSELPDDWGKADLYLGVDWGLRPLARFRLDRSQAPTLVSVPHAGTLRARVIERDVTLTEGVDEEDLAPVLAVDPKRPTSRLRFALDPGGVLDATLEVRRVDPDRASGMDRTPLGAQPLAVRLAGRGSVCVLSGDATDHWRLEPNEGGQHLVFLYLRNPSSEVVVEGWVQGEAAARWTVRPRGRRLVALRRSLHPGGQLLRVRQAAPRGPAGLTGYALLVHPVERDASSLLRTLFRLVSSEASRKGQRSAFLGSRAFALDTYRCLREDGGLSADLLATALLDQLGHRIPEARHLALNLLGVYLPPKLIELETARRGGGRRGADAGLLLTARSTTVRAYISVWRQVQAELEHRRRRADAPAADEEDAEPLVVRPWGQLRLGEREDVTWAVEDALTQGVLIAAGDSDVRMRLRAVAACARIQDQALRVRLRAQLEERLSRDPSRRVQRALLTAFPPPAAGE